MEIGPLSEDWTTSVERRLQTLETFAAVEEVHRINVEKRLASIEDTLKWLVRLILGAMMLGVIGYSISGGFAIV